MVDPLWHIDNQLKGQLPVLGAPHVTQIKTPQTAGSAYTSPTLLTLMPTCIYSQHQSVLMGLELFICKRIREKKSVQETLHMFCSIDMEKKDL